MTIVSGVDRRAEQGQIPDEASEQALSVSGLRVDFGDHVALDQVDLGISRGQVLAVVGGSGSGKTTLARAMLGLLPAGARITPDSRIDIGGTNTAHAPDRRLRTIRGRVVSLVAQDQGGGLDPHMRIGAQIAEALQVHGLGGRRGLLGDREDRKALDAAVSHVLDEVRLGHIPAVASRFPHELSGGQRQRVLIAIALVTNPEVVIADEPTSALDATVAHQILALLVERTRERGLALMLITHDLDVAARYSDSVLVLDRGQVSDYGPTSRVIAEPKGAYTRQLWAARPTGPATERHSPVGDVMVSVRSVSRRIGAAEILRNIDLTIHAGETVAVVGETGSGKSTLGRIIAGFDAPSTGTIQLASAKRSVQLISQSPRAALDPRWTVEKILDEAFGPQPPFAKGAKNRRTRCTSLLDLVGLDAHIAESRPRQLSGGQAQRVAIARALAAQPAALVLDEPVSSLDVLAQSAILDLSDELRISGTVAQLFITHDLAVARRVSDRIIVLAEGQIVEHGDTEEVFAAPKHAVTQALLNAGGGVFASV